MFQNTLGSDILKGSNFITNLRTGWIRHFADRLEDPPIVVQLLGTKDDLVHREDCMDTELFHNSYHIDVPDGKHGDLHKLDKDSGIKYKLLKEAILGTLEKQSKKIAAKREHIIFILHGIRAGNTGWVEQLRSRIHDRDISIKVVNSAYGYFSALGFAIPGIRKSKLAWFRDQYSYYLARYPNATFYFIGHSNGTYLLGQSLIKILNMRFDRVYLAGSVLPRNFDWTKIFDRGQIKALRNDRSAFDWPVAWLCSALRNGLGMKDIGTGGFDGFDVIPAYADRQEVYFYKGDHGKPLEEHNLDNILKFILDNTRETPNNIDYNLDVSRWSLISRWCPVMLWFIFFIIAALVWVLMSLHFSIVNVIITLLVLLFISIITLKNI